MNEKQEDLPVAVWSGEMQLGSVTLKVHVLDNGQRVIDADSMERFMAAMEDGSLLLAEDDATAFAHWLHGGELP